MGKEIGIDLGTTNSIVSYVNRNQHLVTMELTNSMESIIPTVVYYKKRSEVLIGTSAHKKGIIRPTACFRNFKSLLITAPDKKVKIIAENGDVLYLKPGQAMKDFLMELMRGVQGKIQQEFMGIPEMNLIEKVVITIPAKYPSEAVDTLKLAARSAGLKQVKLLMEPTAAAVAYMETRNMKGKCVAVYDFGGGTFDISLLENRDGIFHELYTDGLPDVGGNTLTQEIVHSMVNKINSRYDLEMPYKITSYDENSCEISYASFVTNLTKIEEECNRIKHGLSEEEEEFVGEIPIITGDSLGEVPSVSYFEYHYTADQINKLIEKHIQRTIQKTNMAIRYADQHGYHIDCLILAGGSSHVPMIRQELKKLKSSRTGKLDIRMDDDVSTLISRGAAIVANQDFNTNSIHQISNCEIGIKKPDGGILDAFHPILSDGQPFPVRNSEKVEVRVVNGELWIPIYARDVKQYREDQDTDLTIRSKAVSLSHNILVTGLSKTLTSVVVEVALEYHADLSLKIDLTISADGQVLTSSYKVEKGSNLL